MLVRNRKARGGSQNGRPHHGWPDPAEEVMELEEGGKRYGWPTLSLGEGQSTMAQRVNKVLLSTGVCTVNTVNKPPLGVFFW